MMVTLFSVVLVSLLMTVEALQNSERFEHLYSILLLINVVTLLTLLALIVLNLRNLLSQLHKQRIGARLTIRLLGLLVILSSIPVIVVFYFSLEFLHQRLDNWFNISNINIENTLGDALALTQATLDARMREALKQTNKVAKELALVSDDNITLQLNELSHHSNVQEFTLLTFGGHIIASFSADMGSLLPNLPKESVLLQLKNSDTYISLDSITNPNSHIRVLVKLTNNQQVRLLQALFPTPERIHELATKVEEAVFNYQKRTYLHQPLKLSFTLVLSLVLLLSILSTIWIAFFAARRFVAPLSDLVEGTIAVAQGNYEKQLPVTQLDELGFLVQSFNEMTRKIAVARDEVKQSQQLADNQRTYLEAVLERLSSGVISLDRKLRLRTANPAAAQILGLPLNKLLKQTLLQLQNDYSVLRPLCNAIHPHIVNFAQDWREEITLFGANGRKILICCGTQLRHKTEGKTGGYVIVFDDVTTLVQAQRDAAWSEVARRLAHEIKNPLTPIQLSAERLQHKYLRKLSDKDAETFERLTHTIIQQVDAMKEMVNTFSDYAKIPALHKESLNLNQLIEEVVELYRSIPTLINTQLDENIPNIEADRGRLRQVLHNLIKNALEAKSTDNCITITTHHLTESCLECVEVRLFDQGPGIPEHLLEKVFEPYVTTKTKGTGLGLAIVKKIVEEHGGAVWIEQTQATCIIIRLPVIGDECH